MCPLPAHHRKMLIFNEIIDAKQTRLLIKALQSLAKAAGHERPLMIGIDQENGRLFETKINILKPIQC